MVNIMVVEDEKPISNLIALSLKKAGYHSECAYDGLEGDCFKFCVNTKN